MLVPNEDVDSDGEHFVHDADDGVCRRGDERLAPEAWREREREEQERGVRCEVAMERERVVCDDASACVR